MPHILFNWYIVIAHIIMNIINTSLFPSIRRYAKKAFLNLWFESQILSVSNFKGFFRNFKAKYPLKNNFIINCSSFTACYNFFLKKSDICN